MVAETAATSVSSVARRHGITSSLLFRWRRELGSDGKIAKPKAQTHFVPIALPAPSAGYHRTIATSGGLIEIELSSGRRIRVDGSVDVMVLKRVIAALEER
jgi:transposase